MDTKFKYGNVLEALNYLRSHGYKEDFRLQGDFLTFGDLSFGPKDLKIEVIYRYEGATNPGEEATVYGISTLSGEKGILIVADGTYAENAGSLLTELHQAKMNRYSNND